MACSTVFRSSIAATFAAYIFTGLFCFGPMLLMMLLAMVLSARSVSNLIEEAFLLSPFGMLFAIWGFAGMFGSLVWGVLYQLAVILICRIFLGRRLSRTVEPPKVESTKPIDDPALLRERRRTFPFYLIDPLRRSPLIPDDMNPMWIKELRWGIGRRGAVLIRLFYGFLIGYSLLSLALLYLQGFGRTDECGMWMVIQMVLTASLAPILLVNTFSKEFEIGNMDMLRMTLLDPRDIIRGKLLAGVSTLAPLVLAAGLSNFWLPLVSPGMGWDLFFIGCGTLLVSTFLAACVGLLASVLTRKTSTAIVLSYFLNLCLFLGLSLLVLFIMAGLLQGLDCVEASFVCFFSPIGAFAWNVGNARRGSSLLTLYWTGNVLTFLLLALLTVDLALWRLKASMRDR